MERVKFEDMKNALITNGTPLPISVRMYGRVRYSHVRTKIEGEELKKQNERDKAANRKPEYNPHYSISIDSSVKIQADPNVPQVVIDYLNGKISDKGIYSAKSKSPFPPAFAVAQGLEPIMVTVDNVTMPASNTEQLPAELGKGLLVCLGISIYGSANGVGVGLEYVVACEQVKFIQGGGVNMSEALNKIGVVDPNLFPKQQDEAPAGTPNTRPMATAPMAGQTGVQMPAGQPMQAAPQMAPAPAPAPAMPQGAPAQAPYYGQQPAGFMMPPAGDPLYGTPQAAPAPAPGISYQAN